MLYTPLLPEAAGGSIEPRHVAVPLRTMCPHADLLLGSAVALDPELRTVEVTSDAGRFVVAYRDLIVASARSRGCPRRRAGRARLRAEGPARRDPAAQPRPPPGRARGCGPRPGRAPPDLRLRRRRVLGRRGARRAAASSSPARCAGTGACAASSRASSSSTRRRGSSRRRRRRSPARRRGRSTGAASRSSPVRARLRRRLRHDADRRPPHRRRARRLDRRRRGEPGRGEARPAGRRARPRPGRRDLRGRRDARRPCARDCAAVPNAATPGTRSPDVPARAAPVAAPREEPRRPAQPYRYRTRGHMAALGRGHGIAVLGPCACAAGGLARRARLPPDGSCRSSRAGCGCSPTGPSPASSVATSPS